MNRIDESHPLLTTLSTTLNMRNPFFESQEGETLDMEHSLTPSNMNLDGQTVSELEETHSEG